VAEDLPIIDWGEMEITEDTPLTPGLSRAVVSFALDTVWTDSIGPVFYSPSYDGSYPALTVVRKLSHSPGGQLTLQEALNSGRLLVEAYTSLQTSEALDLANLALARCLSTGEDLAMLAGSDSLELYTTPPFAPMSVRLWAVSDEAAYRGLLGCAEFADVSALAPEFSVTGPFSNSGVVYLAEITARTVPNFDSDPGMLASVYLSLEQGRSQDYNRSFLGVLRNAAEIEDLRDRFYATVDSLRAAESNTL
jgi:hypothetical protein